MHALSELGILAIPGVLGGALGAVCAPLAGWLLLRRIPLGKAFLGLTIGTVLGGVAGWFLLPSFDHSGWSLANLVVRPIFGAAFGFLSMGILMRIRHPRAST